MELIARGSRWFSSKVEPGAQSLKLSPTPWLNGQAAVATMITAQCQRVASVSWAAVEDGMNPAPSKVGAGILRLL